VKFFFFFLSLYAFPPKGALGYEAGLGEVIPYRPHIYIYAPLPVLQLITSNNMYPGSVSDVILGSQDSSG